MLIKIGNEERRNKSQKKMFEYQCDCGDVRFYIATVVNNNRVSSCPICSTRRSAKNRTKDMTGQKVGYWTVISQDTSPSTSRGARYRCRCKCGNERVIAGSDIRGGNSTKCQECSVKIVAKEKSYFKDGTPSDSHRIYRIWKNMKARCHGEYHNKYYSDKDVFVCQEWRDSFISFKDWAMDNGYKENLDIDKDLICDDRKISPKCYSPDTCMWISKNDNARYSATKDLVKKEKLRNALLQRR